MSSGTGDALAFRLAGQADIPALLQLVQRTYRGEESRGGWTTEADLLDGQRTDHRELTEIIDRAGSVVLVAVEGEAILGCCHLEDRGGGLAYLGLFSVQPESQGRGIGRTIVAEAERRAQHSWGATTMQMTVIRQRTELLDWYGRLGYERTGDIVPFPYGDERFGVPRRDDLEFAVIVKPIGEVTARRITTRVGKSFDLAATAPEDHGELLDAFRVVVAAGEGYPQDPAEPVTVAAFDAYWLAPARIGVVARATDGRLAGAYTMKPNNVGRAGHVANAGYFVVADQRSSGLGEALVRDSMEVARSLGFDAMQFNFVFESNPARHLYERLGFEVVGRVPEVIDGEAVCIYWRRL